MRTQVAILLLAGAVAGASASVDVGQQWEAFVHRYGKRYASQQDAQYRFRIFADNLRDIEHLNAMTGGSAAYGVNRFADMTTLEFRRSVLMSLPPADRELLESKTANFSARVGDLPAAFDWREHGAVTDVRDQGSVGSCWAFSTAENIAGQHFLATKELLELSPEFLVDCDDKDCGVFGGWPYRAYQFIQGAGGIPSEADYPYCSGTGDCYPCMANTNKTFCGPPPSYCNKTWNPSHCPVVRRSVKLSDWKAISKDENEIAAALVATGPLSVLLDAENLQWYKSGVWNPDNGPFGCYDDFNSLDHAVLLVGYGTENGTAYWSVKNSWGKDWGENGYFRILRGVGKCGINLGVTTAVVAA